MARGRVLIFMPGHRRDRLTRVYEPLLLSLTRWLTAQSLPHKFVELAWFKYCGFSAHDVAVFVGVDSFLSEHGRFPFSALRANNATAVIYQTEPIATQRCDTFGWSYLRRALTQAGRYVELWDYSAANLKAVRQAALPLPSSRRKPNATRDILSSRGCGLPATLGERLLGAHRDRIQMRHVPPGFAQGLIVQGVADQHATDGTLAFLGEERYRHPRCWSTLNGTDSWLTRHFVSVHAWSPTELQPALSRYAVWLNLHKQCGRAAHALESFRLSTLLSNGVAVLSERSDDDDERLYAGLVVFCNFTELRECHARLIGSEVNRRNQRARAFAQRLDGVRIFDDAGCEQAFRKAH